MAVTPAHVPTEILRLLTAQEAAEYRLVPFAREAGRIRCYGETGHDYTAAAEELEVLYGWQVEVVPIAADDLQRLLLQHYRPGSQTASAAAGRTAEIGQGRQFLFALVGEALRDNASDIHLEPYEQRCRIRMRIDGKLAERYVVERAQYMPLVNQIKILASLDISEKRLPQDGRIGYDRDGAKFDVRVSTLPTIYGEKVVLRLLTRRVELLELRNLGFSARQYEDYCRAIARPFGMVLICGPTGSGKSTTLYATLRRLNALTDNILTIEDPIEYTLEGVNQVQLKEEIGLTFTRGIIALSKAFPVYAAVAVSAGGGLYLLYRANRQREEVQRWRAAILLRLPVAGEIIRKNMQAQCCKLLDLLCAAGVPLLAGVGMLREVIGFHPYRKSFDEIERRLERGDAFAETLARFPDLYDRKLTALVRVGEQTNRLPEMLRRQGETLTEELEYAIRRMGAMLEPALILLVGILVAVILIAMYMPMFSLGGIMG